MYTKQFDLHLHSYYSDGKNSPASVLRLGKKAGFSLLSVTDHNSIAHVGEEQKIADKLKINYVSGVEVSVEFQGYHLHFMGYAFDPADKKLNQVILGIQRKRREGIFTITSKMRDLGFDIEDQELRDLKTEYYGLSHIIRLLLKKPLQAKKIMKEVGSTEIFPVINFYFSPGRPAYVPEDYLPAKQALKIIKEAGGLVSLAHPGFHLTLRDDKLVNSLAKLGLDGLEVFTPKHNWQQIVHYEILAKKLGLVITVGSDYHIDIHNQDIPLSSPLGFLQHPPQVFTNFVRALKRHNGYRLKY